VGSHAGACQSGGFLFQKRKDLILAGLRINTRFSRFIKPPLIHTAEFDMLLLQVGRNA